VCSGNVNIAFCKVGDTDIGMNVAETPTYPGKIMQDEDRPWAISLSPEMSRNGLLPPEKFWDREIGEMDNDNDNRYH
jgi:hypothetical protein